MLDPSTGLFDQLPGMGVGGILAGFLIWLLNKTWKDHIETIKGFHDIEKGRTEMLVGVIKDNTNQTVRNTTVLDSLHRRLDKDAAERSEEKRVGV